jgi:LDH2 family malate/lactate/ureidoglycolate dehydrogenase
MTEYVWKTLPELEDHAYRALIRVGADADNATIVAQHLALADASGVSTHGVVHLPGYVADISAGFLLPAERSELLTDEAAFSLVHGHWTFGQVAALDALHVAMKKAERFAVSLTGLVGCNHIGRLGHYVELAASLGFATMIWTGGYSEKEPHVAPFGGRTRVLGTNPIAFGFPGGKMPALTFDFATTAVAGMKIVTARRRAESLPEGSIVDSTGAPTTDPEEFFRNGAHLPFGGHKGYAISVAAEWLGRMLTGSDRFVEPGRGTVFMAHQGVLFMVMRADAFAPRDHVDKVADEMYERIAVVPPAPGFDRVLLPGQLEEEARRRSAVTGVPVEAEVWSELLHLAGAGQDD